MLVPWTSLTLSMASWLRVPEQRASGLVHGDFRLENCIIGQDGGVRAVLDWELCTQGDPLADLGMLMVYWPEATDAVMPFPNTPSMAPGFPSRLELLEGTPRLPVCRRMTSATTPPSVTGGSAASRRGFTLGIEAEASAGISVTVRRSSRKRQQTLWRQRTWFSPPSRRETPMKDDLLIVDTRDRIATVTLNRPHVRNALNTELIGLLAEAMDAIAADDDVDVVVLTGADPTFCAGLDLRELGDTGDNLGSVPTGGWSAPWAPMTTPVIAAVNGAAVTGGLELVLHADICIASESAMFADTHARVGLVPSWGMSVILPELVGAQRAKLLSMTGQFISAREACAAGLVLEVVPHTELLKRAHEIAEQIVAGDRNAIRTILETQRQTTLLARQAGLRLEAEASAAFRRARFDPAVVAARREDVIASGRSNVMTS